MERKQHKISILKLLFISLIISVSTLGTVLRTVKVGNIYNKVNLSYNEHKTDYDILNGWFSYKDDEYE